MNKIGWFKKIVQNFGRIEWFNNVLDLTVNFFSPHWQYLFKPLVFSFVQLKTSIRKFTTDANDVVVQQPMWWHLDANDCSRWWDSTSQKLMCDQRQVNYFEENLYVDSAYDESVCWLNSVEQVYEIRGSVLDKIDSCDCLTTCWRLMQS